MCVPYDGREFTFHNPDQTVIRVRGWGDQNAAVFETLDGYTVVKDRVSGFYHYATVSSDGSDLVSTGIPIGRVAAPDALGVPKGVRMPNSTTPAKLQAAGGIVGEQLRRWQVRRESKRSLMQQMASATDGNIAPAPPPAGTTGTYVGLCLLVQFPDVPGTITQAQVDAFCNHPGYSDFGNNGSVTDYYEAVSDHKLHYTIRVSSYYTTNHPRSYYTDPKIAYGVRAQEMITEALTWLSGTGFNFSVLSSDGGGFVNALNIFYAGSGVNAYAEGLWPHSSALATKYSPTASKTFSDYQITDMGAQLTLRTFCHENGHMICDFPDLYDTGYQSRGIGDYCLMCYGGSDSNPTQVCAYLKNAAGWASKMTTLSPGLTVTVASGINDFLIHRRSSTEYFLAENRQQTGRDASLPDAGLAIWHIDHFGSNNNEQMTAGQHYECTLEQADNRSDLEKNANLGDITDLYGGPSAIVFGADTLPNNSWWDGNSSGLELEQISPPAASMTLTVRYPGPTGQLKQVFYGGDGVIYVIAANGNLLWYHHDGRSNGTFAWSAKSSNKVGVGWGGLRTVFPGDKGVIYGINDAGDLLWYRHDGRNDGSFTWASGSPKKVGVGWGGLRTVFSGGGGVIYAINDAGDLLWYRHDGYTDGSFNWSAGSPKKVGVGWGGLRTVFAGDNGVIYGINETGDLLWYRHDGRNDGSFTWSAGSPKKVGTGWDGLRSVFYGGDGVIYGINPAGDLLWYRHDGRNDGSFTWAAGSPKKVGTGWVVAGHGVIYAIESNQAPSTGRLLWYRHDGRENGSFLWASGSPKEVGTGWGSLRTVFAGTDKVIYGINEAGDLLWYRHDGRDEGTFAWVAGSPKKVGTGWGSLHHVFSGDDGVIYGVNDAGDLLWYRHDGRHDGTFTWAAGSPKKVGTGWGGMRALFYGGNGVIYAVNAAGDLLWYRHEGRQDGSFTWAAGSPKKVGVGWGSLQALFSGGDGVIYGVNSTGDLLWYRHDGHHDGTFVWSAGSPKKVGVGWAGLRQILSGM
jgi:M6 family metalloprotease-like protein